MDAVLLLVVAAFAFICEYLNASLGMGYGTTLAPLLLLLGFQPLQVVPAVLLGQLAGGFFGGLHTTSSETSTWTSEGTKRFAEGFAFSDIYQNLTTQK